MMTATEFDIDYWTGQVNTAVNERSHNTYIAINKIAKGYGLDPQDIAQDVCEWLLANKSMFEDKEDIRISEHYIVKAINNRIKKICAKSIQDYYGYHDRYIYSKDFVRFMRKELIEGLSGEFTIDSMAHIAYLDFQIAYNSLNEKEQLAFESESMEPKDRAARSRADSKVHQRMNGLANVRVSPVRKWETK